MNQPKERMNKYVRNGIILMFAMVLSPVLIQVIVEQVKGPGYGASAAEIMLYVILSMSLLGWLHIQNLVQAIRSVKGEQHS